MVLPVPGGPYSSIEDTPPPSTSRRSGVPWPEQGVLADDLVEGARAHPDGERRAHVHGTTSDGTASTT